MLNFRDYGFVNRNHVVRAIRVLNETPHLPVRQKITEQQVKYLFLNTITRCATGMFPAYIDRDQYLHCYWSGSDNFENYLKKSQDPIMRVQLSRAGWFDSAGRLATTIDYRLNHHGFRCDHFNESEGIAFFGCSFTYGVGIHENQTWAHHVAQHYSTKCWNLGLPGQSLNPGVFYALNYLDEDLPNIKAIAVLEPPPGRIPVYGTLPSGAAMVLSNLLQIIENESSSDTLLASVLANQLTLTSEMDRIKNIKALQLIAKSRNIPLVRMSTVDSYGNFQSDARDGSHFGVGWQRAVAGRMITELDKYLT